MVIQILPRDTRYGDVADSFGSLGEGIGAGIGMAIGSKVSQVRARNAFKSYNINDEQADALSRLPMKQRNKMLSDLGQHATPNYGEQEIGTTQQRQQSQPITPSFEPSAQTVRNVAGMKALPYMMGRQAGISNPLQAAYQAEQGINNYQAQLATGQPQNQLMGAQGGLRDLQRASLSGLLGNPQQSIQQQQQPQRQLGQAPSLASAGGIAPVLPSDSVKTQPRAPIDESGIPIQYQGLGLKPYKKPDRTTYQGIMSGPKIGEEDKAEKAHYENQIKAKENASKAEKPKIDKIYKEADAAQEQLPALEKLSELNKAGKIQYSSISKGNWIGQSLGVLGIGEKQSTEYAKELLHAIPPEIRAELGVAGSAKVRQVKLDKLIEERKTALARKDALESVIDESNGWVPKDVDRIVNQRVKLQQREERKSPIQQQEVLEEEPDKSNYLAQITAPVVRAAENIAGFPGDIASLGARGIQYATGSENAALKSVADNPLTSSSIRENVTKRATGELFEPRSQAGELYQDILGTAISLVAPGGASKILSRTAKAAAAVTGGKVTGAALRATGADPLSSAIGEAVATGIFMGGAFKNKVEKAKSALYTEANQIADTAKETFPTTSLRKKIFTIHNDISGRDMQGKKFMQDRLAGIADLANKPRATIRELWDAKKDINSHWPDAPSGIKPYMKDLLGTLKEDLYAYGKENKAWARTFPEAEALETGLRNAYDAAETVRNSKALSSIPWVGKWANAAKGIGAQAKEVATLGRHSKHSKKLFGQFYSLLLAQDIVAAERKARQIQQLEK